MFNICGNKGFHITFSNGITLSTQIGGGNYCNNYDFDILSKINPPPCENCEIAIFNKKGNFITGKIIKKYNLKIDNDGSVAGYVSFKNWLDVFNTINKITKKELST
jgi:hypothetical protein